MVEMCGPRPAYGLFKGAPLVVTKRSPLAVVVLTVVTFGLYAYWWLYRTTKELQREPDRDDLRPLLDDLGREMAIDEAHLLHDDDIYAANTLESPERVGITALEATIEDTTLRIPLPAVSWGCIRLS